MAIRNTAKALIVEGDRILLNRCMTESGETYYDLPGGGQNQFESMEEAVVREVLEETGRGIRIIRFAALGEVIFEDSKLREKYYEYSHRMFHIFLAKLDDKTISRPAEMDFQQEDSIWLELAEADKVEFRPILLNGRISQLVHSGAAVYLGCERERLVNPEYFNSKI